MWGFDISAGSRVNGNLSGNVGPITRGQPEIRTRLAAQGITMQSFPECTANTRLNLKYMEELSDIIGEMQTFRNQKVVFQRLTLAGGESQIIKTEPQGDGPENWRQCQMKATSFGCESTAQMGVSYLFGFQLFKEAGPGGNMTEHG